MILRSFRKDCFDKLTYSAEYVIDQDKIPLEPELTEQCVLSVIYAHKIKYVQRSANYTWFDKFEILFQPMKNTDCLQGWQNEYLRRLNDTLLKIDKQDLLEFWHELWIQFQEIEILPNAYPSEKFITKKFNKVNLLRRMDWLLFILPTKDSLEERKPKITKIAKILKEKEDKSEDEDLSDGSNEDDGEGKERTVGTVSQAINDEEEGVVGTGKDVPNTGVTAGAKRKRDGTASKAGRKRQRENCESEDYEEKDMSTAEADMAMEEVVEEPKKKDRRRKRRGPKKNRKKESESD